MSVGFSAHAAFTIRSIGGMWQGDCECGKSLLDYKDSEALLDALQTHGDEELR